MAAHGAILTNASAYARRPGDLRPAEEILFAKHGLPLERFANDEFSVGCPRPSRLTLTTQPAGLDIRLPLTTIARR